MTVSGSAGVDLKLHENAETQADGFVIGDLREQAFCRSVIDMRFEEVYQLAADMGGAGLSSRGARCRRDAQLGNDQSERAGSLLSAQHQDTFHSSSACLCLAYYQEDPDNSKSSEDSAIRRRLKASMAARSCSAGGCIWVIIAIAACRGTSRGTTTPSVRKAPGRVGREGWMGGSADLSPQVSQQLHLAGMRFSVCLETPATPINHVQKWQLHGK
jgi:hypothetical protein